MKRLDRIIDIIQAYCFLWGASLHALNGSKARKKRGKNVQDRARGLARAGRPDGAPPTCGAASGGSGGGRPLLSVCPAERKIQFMRPFGRLFLSFNGPASVLRYR